MIRKKEFHETIQKARKALAEQEKGIAIGLIIIALEQIADELEPKLGFLSVDQSVCPHGYSYGHICEACGRTPKKDAK